MYKFQPFYDERYYFVTLIDELLPEECRNFIQDYINFENKINFIRCGAVLDMRQFKAMSSETQDILTEGMILGLKIGFTCAGRVFNKITDEMILKLRESNVKAGFLAQYFNDIPKAVEYVKDTLSKYPATPVITRSEAISLLETKYPYYKIT